MDGNYGYIALFLLGGAGFVCFNFTLASFVTRLVQESPIGHQSKGIAYECGEPPSGEAWLQYNVRYYLYAMLFVIFDVEAAYMIPWAAEFRKLLAELGTLMIVRNGCLPRHPGGRHWSTPGRKGDWNGLN